MLAALLAFGVIRSGPAVALDWPEWTIKTPDAPGLGDMRSGAGDWIDRATLLRNIGNADVLAAGEIHPNPDHHALQAALLDAMIASGKRPTIVWEMVPPSLQGTLDEATDTSLLGTALEWEDRGWPAWEMYAPIAELALANDLPMRAGGIDRDLTRALARGEASEADRDRLGLSIPWDTSTEDALLRVLDDGHCNLVPQERLGPMLTVQRARDGALAEAAKWGVAETGNAFVVAGNGHVRTDWGVAAVLNHTAPDLQVFSIGLIEVPLDPIQQPYDVTILTPPLETPDPCIALRKRFQKPAPSSP
ncbi:MAG: ChaN family lipoprotein [Pseudomonadota bacterium]